MLPYREAGKGRHERLPHDGKSLIKFCNSCGAEIMHRVPEGDSLPRAVCDACGHIQYENPKIVVGSPPGHR